MSDAVPTEIGEEVRRNRKNFRRNLPWSGAGYRGCKCCEASVIPKGDVCRYHWAVEQWGEAWADRCFPEFKRRTT